MKKLVSILMILLGIVVISFGQNSNHGNKQSRTSEEQAEMHTQRLTKELTLSADQTSKVKAVLVKSQQSEESIKTKYANATDKTQMKSEMKTLHDQTDAELKEIFTADQYTKYQTSQTQGHGDHHGGGNEHGDHHKGKN